VVRVWDPYEQRAVRFSAVLATEILDSIWGDAWRTQDELVFECSDGYRAGVPVARLLRHRAHFAFARADRDDGAFVIDKPVAGEVERTSLSPAYLIWENENDEIIRREGDWGWPYQIVAVHWASVAERYARLTPPADATPQALEGFGHFRRYCSRCHAINGQGGQVGPELNYPASVTEYIRSPWLTRWIADPTSVRHGTPMPGLPRDVPDRDVAVQALVAYLEAMSRRKLAPDAPDPAHADPDAAAARSPEEEGGS
jgi:mono/diheme cytochrome c family protein